MSRHLLGDRGVSTELMRRVNALPRSSTWRLTALPLSARGVHLVRNALTAYDVLTHGYINGDYLASLISIFS